MEPKFNSIISDSINGQSITFNRFLNSNPTSSTGTTHQNVYSNPVIVSSEDEQQTGTNSLLEFIESELRRSRRSPNKKRKIVRAQPSFVCLGVKGRSDKKKKRYDNGKLKYIYF